MSTSGRRWLLAIVTALAVWAKMPIARADCLTAAKSELANFHDGIVQSASLDDKSTGIQQNKCAADKSCYVVFFKSGAMPSEPPAAPKEKGFSVPDGGWRPVGQVKGSEDCKTLFEFVYQKPVAEVAAVVSRSAASKQALLNVAPNQVDTADKTLEAFKKAPRSYTALTPNGQGQVDVEAIATETLQILGQLVVDRASAKGYALLQAKLEKLLECSDNGTHFPATCAVLKALRLQDIAMAPKSIADAFATDMLNLLLAQQVAPTLINPSLAEDNAGGPAVPAAPAVPATPPPPTADQVLGNALIKLALSLVTKSGQNQQLVVDRALAALTQYASAQQSVSSLSATPAKQAALFGVLALARCVADTDGSSTGLAGCKIEDELKALNAPEVVVPAATQLTEQLIQVVATPKSDTTARVQLAIDTVAETACMLLTNSQTPTLECPAVETIAKLDRLAAVAFADAFADALLTKDSSRVVVVAAEVVDLAWAQDKDKLSKRSALRLLAGLLDYAATYAQPSDAQGTSAADNAHAQRTKILESLTQDMSDRTGRSGDTVFSLGGALRVLGGIRIPRHGSGSALYGPLSLPLGLAVTRISSEGENGWGFHAQFDAVDLGNYLALDNGPTVKKPALGDAFAPGVSIGVAYGASMPFVLTATGSYTPQFVLDPSQPDKHGSFNIGLAFGIHVPLIDLN